MIFRDGVIWAAKNTRVLLLAAAGGMNILAFYSCIETHKPKSQVQFFWAELLNEKQVCPSSY